MDMHLEGNGLFGNVFLSGGKGMSRVIVTVIWHSCRLCSFRYSILPALSLDGILALEVVQGSFTKIAFAHFIDGLLDRMNPFPGPNSVIVMDNCSIHKSELIQEMIRARLVLFLFRIDVYLSDLSSQWHAM